MVTEPKLVGLFGLFGIGNIGNDGSLESMVRFLRRVAPGERLICVCGDPAVVNKAFGLDTVPIYSRFRAWIGGRTGVLLQKAAGGDPVAAQHSPSQTVQGADRPRDGRIGRFRCQPPRMAARYSELVSFGAPDGREGDLRQYRRRTDPSSGQPVVHEGGRSSRSLPVLSRRGLEGVHGEHRVRHARRSDLSGHRVPAAGTRVDPPAGPRRPAALHRRRCHDLPRLAQRPEPRRRDLCRLSREDDQLPGLALERGHVVRLLMGDEVDRRAVDDLFRAVRSRRPDRAEGSMLFAPAHTLHDVMHQMADTDLVVATRYHNVVCALRVGKPTISVGYAEKNDVLLTEMGLGDYCQHIECLDVELLKAQTMRLILDLPAIEARVCQVSARFDRSLREQENLLASLICSDASAVPSTRPSDAREPAI